MRRRFVTVAVMACLVLGAAGCSSDEDSAADPAAGGGQQSGQSAQPATPAAPLVTGGPTVQWANSFCTPINTFTQQIQTKLPQVQGNADANSAMAALAVFFEDLATSVGVVVSDLEKLAPAPTPEGDRIKDTVLATFGSLRESFAGTADRLRGGDAAAAQQAIQDFSGKMQGLAEPFKVVPVSPELKQALQEAPACKSLSQG